MRVRTEIHAGDIIDDVARGVKNTGNYLARMLQEADAQATRLANDTFFYSTTLADCLNTTIRARQNR